jgi:hypothetical protein
MEEPIITFKPSGKPLNTITIISSGYYDIDSHALDMLNAGRSPDEINKYITEEVSKRPKVQKKKFGFVSEHSNGVITIRPNSDDYVAFVTDSQE